MTSTHNFDQPSQEWTGQPGQEWSQQSDWAHQPQYAPEVLYGTTPPDLPAEPHNPYAVDAAASYAVQAPYANQPQATYPSQPPYENPAYAPQAYYPAQPPAPYSPQGQFAGTQAQAQYAPHPQYTPSQPSALYPPQGLYRPETSYGPTPQAAYAVQPQMPYTAPAYYGGQAPAPAENAGRPEKKTRLGKLAWAALILGIVGFVGSFVPILGYVTMFAAVIGGILGVIAFFGSRKILSSIGIVLCVLAVILTVAVTKAFAESVDDSLGSTSVASASGAGSTDKSTGSSKAPKNVYKFGQTITFADGSTLRVEKPVKFTPGQYAITGDKKPLYLKFRTTFVNKTSEVFDPTMTTASASAAGEESETVYDDGLGTPDNKVLPGKSVTWWTGYGVTSQKDLQLEVEVGFMDYDTVIFTN